jgi:hypothetical protein
MLHALELDSRGGGIGSARLERALVVDGGALGAQVYGLGQSFKDMGRRYVGVVTRVGFVAMGPKKSIAL